MNQPKSKKSKSAEWIMTLVSTAAPQPTYYPCKIKKEQEDRLMRQLSNYINQVSKAVHVRPSRLSALVEMYQVKNKWKLEVVVRAEPNPKPKKHKR